MAPPAFAAAKVIGFEHLRNGSPCQDEVGCARVGERIVVAVSDGHGSSAHADVGSRLAITVTLHTLAMFAEQFGDEPLEVLPRYAKHPLRQNIVRSWTDAVHEYGRGDRSDLRAHGATLAFASSLPEALVIGLVGDCDILLVDHEGAVSRPLRAREYPGEQTASLCQTDGTMDFDIVVLPAPRSETLLILSTDGYGKSYVTEADFEMIGPWYLREIREKGLEALASRFGDILTKTTAQGSEDDIGIAMLYWRPPAVATAACETAEASGTDDVKPPPVEAADAVSPPQLAAAPAGPSSDGAAEQHTADGPRDRAGDAPSTGE